MVEKWPSNSEKLSGNGEEMVDKSSRNVMRKLWRNVRETVEEWSRNGQEMVEKMVEEWSKENREMVEIICIGKHWLSDRFYRLS